MIVQCGSCQRAYDVSKRGAKDVLRCGCDDLLVLPDPDQLEVLNVIPDYLERWAQTYGKTAEQFQVAGGWEFIAGSALVRIEHDDQDESVTIESAVLAVPDEAEKRLALFTRLLDLNHRKTGGARFAIREGHVVVTATRARLGLDYVEFQRVVDDVARTADDYDEELNAEFSEAAGDADE